LLFDSLNLLFHGNPFFWTGAAGRRAGGTGMPDYTRPTVNVYGEPERAAREVSWGKWGISRPAPNPQISQCDIFAADICFFFHIMV
jgi:hypothetical protein